ncbi:hypothetical protein P879_10730 [Paragonimus westermani]|uniref:Acyl-CoA dehydrogenase/oxidase N-terminal domain-containing protein n=1 Tax=Paragonimus westermani TaxID=34504 RepID=A0A8T0CYG4_9TREM|nr:hypothetical protein P879_10730 [Paragonimus westermani]
MNQSVIYRFISRAHFKLFYRSKISQFPTNDDLYNFSDEQKDFRKTLQSFVCSEVYPIANTTDVMDNVGDMRSLWKKFGAMGLLGVTAPGVFQPSTNVVIQKSTGVLITDIYRIVWPWRRYHERQGLSALAMELIQIYVLTSLLGMPRKIKLKGISPV